MTTLHGSLDTVSLPDVLRLIASSAKTGLLRIDNSVPPGRVFITEGRISFVTTRDEDDPIDDLLRMEYLTAEHVSPSDRRVVDLAELMDTNPGAFSQFFEQVVVEVLGRLLRSPTGDFRFDEDITTRREVPHSFDVEEAIAKAEARAEEWRRILEVVPSTAAPFRLAPRLDSAEQVVLGAREWSLLASAGASASVVEVAQRLKVFEFAAAKKVAELVDRGLIEFVRTEIQGETIDIDQLPNWEAESASPEPQPPTEPVPDPEPEPPTEAVPDPEPEPPTEAAPDPEPQPPKWVTVAWQQSEDPTEEPSHQVALDDEPPGEQDQELLVEDEADDSDLATRWKNLRKARRGAHAATD